MFARVSYALSVCLLFTSVVQAADYKTFNEAMTAAAKESRARNIAGTLEPLEAALSMAPDERSRQRVYHALLAPYRMLPDHEKFMSACEYLLDNSETDVQKSLVVGDLVNFIKQRGQQDALIAHYEKRAKQDPKDRVSLMVLGDAYASIKRDPEEAIKYYERLVELDTKDGGKLDERIGNALGQQYVAAKQFEEAAVIFEKVAQLKDETAAWYWKEAAVAWKNAGDGAKSLAAAQKAVAAPTEKRSELLTYFWNDAIGDIFAEHGDKAKAKSHYETAVASTKIDGYKKKTQEKLAALQ